jgi:beta-phosphoglucomutase-like phosphatase (HAD superfamily)
MTDLGGVPPEAARRLAVARGGCLVLEDSSLGVQAAAAGMECVLVPASAS